MRENNTKFLRNSSQKITNYAIETRDGIMWDHIPAQRICRVKVQGSNELIVAYYPESWVTVPTWLKPGVPIRIIHRGGLRGRIEVDGLGQTIPSPVEGDTFPPIAVGGDTVLTGCGVIPIPNDPQLKVMIKVGTYRINGVTYILGPIKMSAAPVLFLGYGGAMNEIGGVVEIDAAPAAGFFRIDLVVVGIDGVIDVVKGTNFATTEDVPDVPAGHIELGRVLLYNGLTEIGGADINRSWIAPTVSLLGVTLSDDDLAWAELTSTITCKGYDPYGNSILTAGGLGWYITVEFVSGNGTLNSVEEGDSLTKVGGHTGAAGNQYAFTYTRDQADPGDESPTLKITLEISFVLTETVFIILRDAGGAIMT